MSNPSESSSTLSPSVILEDTVWDTNMNIQGSVAVFPNTTLAIRGTSNLPVIVTFLSRESSIQIHTEAHLDVQDAKLIYYGTTRRTTNSAKGIGFLDEDSGGGASLKLTRAVVQGMNIGISLGTGNSLFVSDSIFLHNYQAIFGTAGQGPVDYFSIQNTYFVNNSYALDGSLMGNFTNCVFSNNLRAVNSNGLQAFKQVIFERNDIAIARINDFHFFDFRKGMENYTYIENGLFYRNGVGLQNRGFFKMSSGSGYGPIRRVTFLENDQGIASDDAFGDMKYINFVDNNISVYYTGTKTETLDNIYWGSSDESTIRSTIYDAYAGSGKGIIQFNTQTSEPYQHSMFDEDILVKTNDYIDNIAPVARPTTNTPVLGTPTQSPAGPDATSYPTVIPPPVVNTYYPSTPSPVVAPYQFYHPSTYSSTVAPSRTTRPVDCNTDTTSILLRASTALNIFLSLVLFACVVYIYILRRKLSRYAGRKAAPTEEGTFIQNTDDQEIL